jgi:exosortase A-associated hydrolase 1
MPAERGAVSTPAERFLVLDCHGEQCMAVYSPPQDAASSRADLGVVIVVGGPQYRVGSHRQFVLLARNLADSGIPVVRFDYRGMGDSDGEARTFESIEDDVAAAVGALERESGRSRIVLWGLCDGASAALMYAASDARIAGVVAVNPWARTPQGEARTRLQHYYIKRIASLEFWRKVFARGVDIKRGADDLLDAIKGVSSKPSSAADIRYLQRMHEGWRRFGGSVLFLLSGQDYTAREFESWIASDADLGNRLRMSRCEVQRFEDADHTFSTLAWREAVSQVTIRWVRNLGAASRH